MNIRISETVKKKNYIERKRKDLEQKIKDQVTLTLYEQIKRKGDNYKFEELNKCSERQKKKYHKLRYGVEQQSTERMDREERVQQNVNNNHIIEREHTEE